MDRKKLKIALVDDDQAINEQNRTLLTNIKVQENFSDIDFEVNDYNSGQDLLNANITYDFILLDYEMPQMDGITTAIEIEKRNPTTRILFLTGYDQLIQPMKKGYSIKNIHGFMFKSDSKAQLQFEIEQMIKSIVYVELIEMECFVEKKDEHGKIARIHDTEFIDVKKIVMIESLKKRNSIYMENDTMYDTKLSLAQLSKILPHDEFSFVNKSCVVNFKYVQAVQKRNLILANGDEVKIGKVYENEFKEKKRAYKRKKVLELC